MVVQVVFTPAHACLLNPYLDGRLASLLKSFLTRAGPGQDSHCTLACSSTANPRVHRCVSSKDLQKMKLFLKLPKTPTMPADRPAHTILSALTNPTADLTPVHLHSTVKWRATPCNNATLGNTTTARTSCMYGTRRLRASLQPSCTSACRPR